MELLGNDDSHRLPVKALFSDQLFLLNFIMSTYLGPDVKFNNSICSAFERLAKGAPPYTMEDLGPSFIGIPLLESLYYYVLRNADVSLVLKPNMLRMYLKGTLLMRTSGLTEDSWQFPNFFPLQLHEQKWFPASFRIVKAIIIIDDPVTSFMNHEDLDRFKYLSGIHNLKIDLNECVCYRHEYQTGKEVEQNCINIKEKITGTVSNRDDKPSTKFQATYKRRRDYEALPQPAFPNIDPVVLKHNSKEVSSLKTCKSDGPAIMPLMFIPNVEECTANTSVVLTGTARKGLAGPPVGLADIGVGKTAYFFRVALPGVKKEFCKFSCEIESDGKVHISGSTTGGKTIRKQSRVFKMKFQQLCRSGPFTLSFNLPGPVDPRLFSPNFRSDGIFEAVIIKLSNN